MNKKNVGKEFEATIYKALNKIELGFSIDRLPDPVGGFMGVRNISDYQGYKLPFQYYIECKCTYSNTLNFKSNITKDQWEGLTEKSKILGILSGICVWFIDYDKTYFVPIQELNRLRFELDKKSLNIKDIADVDCFEIMGKKKRVYFEYNSESFIANLDSFCKKYWNIKSIEVNYNE